MSTDPRTRYLTSISNRLNLRSLEHLRSIDHVISLLDDSAPLLDQLKREQFDEREGDEQSQHDRKMWNAAMQRATELVLADMAKRVAANENVPDEADLIEAFTSARQQLIERGVVVDAAAWHATLDSDFLDEQPTPVYGRDVTPQPPQPDYAALTGRFDLSDEDRGPMDGGAQ